MNKTNNKRRQVTQEKLAAALLELVAREPDKSLTIARVCTAAGVNRSTFYINYPDLTALKTQVRSQLLSGQPRFFASIEAYTPETLLAFLRHVACQRRLYQLYFRLSNQPDLTLVGGRTVPVDQVRGLAAYRRRIAQAGLWEAVAVWLAGNCRETPEELLAVIAQSLQLASLPGFVRGSAL